ncbi:hypothetical protein NTD80_21845 [Pseudomonas sp. 13B_2.1_Bac1]|uniref:hypothetical protein n=1 Tax=Pseudomonas sp. 13B_2.1_Bac1 TaxID=2971624 RepID=UPI0021CA1C43|nr:hypothetical protein [Pseudomonas sp. 13B_2.1_Bac1]MCU1785393.1 hypothetical protein [Pseudomonas sp. 13B_2.1_Bac1]
MINNYDLLQSQGWRRVSPYRLSDFWAWRLKDTMNWLTPLLAALRQGMQEARQVALVARFLAGKT